MVTGSGSCCRDRLPLRGRTCWNLGRELLIQIQIPFEFQPISIALTTNTDFVPETNEFCNTFGYSGIAAEISHRSFALSDSTKAFEISLPS